MADVVVVDASLALKWVARQPYSDAATQLLSQWGVAGTAIIAPALFIYEITNALYKYVKYDNLPREDARLALHRLLAIGPTLETPRDAALSDAATDIAQRTNRPATYDAYYIALAQREGCELWTADERLYNAVHAVYPFVRWIGGWSDAAP